MSSTQPEAQPVLAQPVVLVTPGTILRNGATVVAARQIGQHTQLDAVVLAIYHGEYVTWVANVDGSATSWGHYLGRDFAKAVADYTNR